MSYIKILPFIYVVITTIVHSLLSNIIYPLYCYLKIKMAQPFIKK